MKEDILLKSSCDPGAETIDDDIDGIYRDYLFLKNEEWSNFKSNIFISIQKFQSHAMVMIKEHDIPKTYQQAAEKLQKGVQEMEKITARLEEGEFSEKILEDMLENEMYHFSMTSKVFLAVVYLIHSQENLLKSFLLHFKFGNSLSKYIYSETEINKNFIKQNNNYAQKSDGYLHEKRLEKLFFNINFLDLLKLIDRKKYTFGNCPFWNDILECNDFCNYLKHGSDKIIKNLLKNDKIENGKFFYPIGEKNSRNFYAEMFSLEIFFRYIKAFEDFWMYVFKNSVKLEDQDEFTDTMIREQGNHFRERNKKFPWHQE